MIELAQFLIISILAGAVGFLFYDRRRINESLTERIREDVVTQTELDGYHHRVVQLYQTQRDWSRGKFEESDHRLKLLEKTSKGPQLEAAPPIEPYEKPGSVLMTSPTLNSIPPPVEAAPAKTPSFEPAPETIPETDSYVTAEERVLRAWALGQSIDQIAQELRIGRQEVQLLIQVSRRRPGAPVGV